MTLKYIHYASWIPWTMYSSHNHLKRKTPNQGIDREEFIEHLVEEYYTTTNVEAQEQVTANLANFAYDPINWNYLKTFDALKLFIELLETPNEKLHVHSSAGLCNICLDPQAHSFLIKKENIKIIKDILSKTKNLNVILNILTLLYQLSQISKTNILCASTLKQVKHLAAIYNNDKRIVNISSLLIERFGKRYEVVEINSDNNYIHTVSVPTEERKVHGALLNAIVAGIIGTKFPGGGSIVVEQTLSFPKPCRIDEDCEFVLKLEQERKISVISYECKQNKNIVFKGQVKLLTTSICN